MLFPIDFLYLMHFVVVDAELHVKLLQIFIILAIEVSESGCSILTSDN